MATLSLPSKRLPPGPPGRWLSGNLPEFRHDRLDCMTRWARQYGDLVGNSSRLLEHLSEHFGLESDPETIRLMCQDQAGYSEDASGRAGFEPQGAHRRPPLEAAQEAEVLEVVGNLAARLAERRLLLSGGV